MPLSAQQLAAQKNLSYVLAEKLAQRILKGEYEPGPIICYEDWTRFKPGSCGKAAPRMEVKILSSDPENIPGEIVCRGPVRFRENRGSPVTVHVQVRHGVIQSDAILDGSLCDCLHFRVFHQDGVIPSGSWVMVTDFNFPPGLIGRWSFNRTGSRCLGSFKRPLDVLKWILHLGRPL